MILQTLKRVAQIFLFGVVLVLTPLASGSAQESVAEMVLNDCATELDDYCSAVAEGRGRIVACLYAHDDLLSDQCEGTLEVGIAQFRMILAAVGHVVEQCRTDLDKHCEGVEIGGGQVHQCLSENRASLQETCKAAFSKAEQELK